MRARRSARRRVLAGIAIAVVVGALITACTSSPSEKHDHAVARIYLSAFEAGQTSAAAAVTTDSAAASAALAASMSGLGTGAHATFTLGAVEATSKTASTAAYTASWTLPGTTAKWTYSGTLPLVRSSASKTNGGWLVQWNVHDVQPRLAAGQHLSIGRVQPARAALDDSAGHPLFTKTAVVFVSVNPARVTDAKKLATTLGSVLKISSAGILATIKATSKGEAAPIITLRRSAYLQIKSKIYSLPGTQFATGSELLGPSSRFAQPLLGQVGAATKEIIDASKGTIVAGDLTGLSGLQRALNAQLAGTPGVSVFAAYPLAAAGAPAVAAPTRLAVVSPAVPGDAVTLTLNRADQTAAEAALAAVAKPAAIVITQPSTGKILAVANSAAATDDIALVGPVPAGLVVQDRHLHRGVHRGREAEPDHDQAVPRHHPGQRADDQERELVQQGHDPAVGGVRVLLQHDRREARARAAGRGARLGGVLARTGSGLVVAAGQRVLRLAARAGVAERGRRGCLRPGQGAGQPAAHGRDRRRRRPRDVRCVPSLIAGQARRARLDLSRAGSRAT